MASYRELQARWYEERRKRTGTTAQKTPGEAAATSATAPTPAPVAPSPLSVNAEKGIENTAPASNAVTLLRNAREARAASAQSEASKIAAANNTQQALRGSTAADRRAAAGIKQAEHTAGSVERAGKFVAESVASGAVTGVQNIAKEGLYLSGAHGMSAVNKEVRDEVAVRARREAQAEADAMYDRGTAQGNRRNTHADEARAMNAAVNAAADAKLDKINYDPVGDAVSGASTVNFGDRYAQSVATRYADVAQQYKLAGTVANAIGGMLPAIASNFVAPGSSMSTMFMSAAGGATQSAIDDGADPMSALAYGMAVGGVEALTEKMFDGVSGLLGKGYADDALKALTAKITADKATQGAVLYVMDMLGEGFEEFVAEYADAVLNKLMIGSDARTLKEISSDALYSALIGGLVSGVMQVPGAIRGGNVDANALADATVDNVRTEVSKAQPSVEETQADIRPEQAANEQERAQNAPESPQSVFTPEQGVNTQDNAEALTEPRTASDDGFYDPAKGPGAAAVRKGPQVPSVNNLAIDQNLDDAGREQALASTPTHERVSAKLANTRADALTIEDTDGNWINLKDTMDDLEQMMNEGRTPLPQEVKLAERVMRELNKEASRTGDFDAFNAFNEKISASMKTAPAQALQAWAEFSDSASGVVVKASDVLRQSAQDPQTESNKRKAVREGTKIKKTAEAQVDDAIDSAIEQIERNTPKPKKRKASKQNDNTPAPLWRNRLGVETAESMEKKVASSDKAQKTSMEIILSDILSYTGKLVPKNVGAITSAQTALEKISQYYANKSAYDDALSIAQSNLRQKYADDPAMLEIFDNFFKFDFSKSSVFFRAIMETAKDSGYSTADLMNLNAVGASTTAKQKIHDAFIRAIGEENANDPSISEAITKYVDDLSSSDKFLPQDRALAYTNKCARESGIKKDDIVRSVSDGTESDTVSAIAKSVIERSGADMADYDAVHASAQAYFDAVIEDYRNTRSADNTPTPLWGNRLGTETADALGKQLNPKTPKSKTAMETILADVLSYTRKLVAPASEQNTPKRTAVERIHDYYANKTAYDDALDVAKKQIGENYANDPDTLAMFDELFGFDFNSSDIFTMAIMETAKDSGLTASDIANMNTIGAVSAAKNKILQRFIETVDPDPEEERFIKSAIDSYVDNIIGRDSSENRMENIIKGGLAEMGTDIRHTVKQNWRQKEELYNGLVDVLVTKYALSEAEADEVANNVATAFYGELAQRTGAALERSFGEKAKAKPAVTTFLEKAVEFINEGALTDEAFSGIASERLFGSSASNEILKQVSQYAETAQELKEDEDPAKLRELIAEIAAQRGYKPSNSILGALGRVTDIDRLYTYAQLQAFGLAVDEAATNAGEAVSTYQMLSHLLNAKTMLRNVSANTIFSQIDTLAHNLGVIPDIIIAYAQSLANGKPVAQNRAVGYEKFRIGAEGRRTRQEYVDAARLDNALDMNSGNAIGKYTGDSTRTNRTTNRTFDRDGFSGILNRAEGAAGFGLNVTDAFQKGTTKARSESATQPLVQAGGKVTQAVADNITNSEMLYRSFQRSTALGTALQSVKEVGNLIGFGKSGKKIKGAEVHSFGLGDLVMKYTRVPGALPTTAMDYTPLGAFDVLTDIFKMSKFMNANQAEQADGGARYEGLTNAEAAAKAQYNAAVGMGRMITGSGIIALAGALAKAGLLSLQEYGGDDRDRDEAMSAQGVSGLQFNTSLFWRMLTGGETEWQDGDKLWDVSQIQPLDALLRTGAVLADEENDQKALNVMRECAESLAKSVGELSMFTTASTIANNIRYHGDEGIGVVAGRTAMDVATDAATGFIPAIIRQTASASDDVRRVTTGDTMADTLINKVKSAIPGLRQTLPAKPGIDGQPATYTGDAAINAANAYLLPWTVSKYKQDEVLDYIDTLPEPLAGGDLYPIAKAPNSVTDNGVSYTLDAQAKNLYAQTCKTVYYGLCQEFIGSGLSDGMSAQDAAEVFKYLKGIAAYTAKTETVQNAGGSPAKEYGWIDGIEDIAGAVALRQAVDTLTESGGEDNQSWNAAYGWFRGLKKNWQDVSGTPSAQQSALLSGVSGLEDLTVCVDAGLSTVEYFDCKQKHDEINKREGMSATDKANAFANWLDTSTRLSADEISAVKSAMTYHGGTTADSGAYDALRSAGLSATQSAYIIDGQSALTPDEGYSTVRALQRVEVVTASDLSEDEKIRAIRAQLVTDSSPDAAFYWDAAYSAGVPLDTWAGVMRYLDDEYPGKSVSQERLYNAMLGKLTYEQAESMWNAYIERGRWKTSFREFVYG